MYCTGCGSAIGEGAAFCSVCGRSTGEVASTGAAAPVVVEPLPAAPTGSTQAGARTLPPVALAMPQVGYAGFWLRLVALLIDSVVLWFVFVPILAITGLGAGLLGAISSAGQSGDPSEVITAIFSTGFVGLIGLFFMGRWLYFALMECSTWQATLGKKALGLYVTDLAGERITFGRASGRYFGKIISGLILYIGFIMAGFTERKQALHDMMAGCLVLRKL